ncbi:MAG: hypothetical protein KKE76_04625 [Gammaproteobacteria bacterium]|nr:hypothetical protein [Gammaproteobacteria bacterium]
MANAKQVYAELRQPLQRAGTLLAGLLILMVVSGLFNNQMNKSRQAAEQSFNGLVQDYRRALQSEQILLTETSRFAHLQAQGIVGPEPRLRWVQDIREVAQRVGLVAINYELEPRTPATLAIATGSYQLFVSLMRLKLELRHEGDLLRFINLLVERQGGLFELSACALSRMRDDEPTSLHASNIKVDCELRWYSLDSADSMPTGDAQ